MLYYAPILLKIEMSNFKTLSSY